MWSLRGLTIARRNDSIFFCFAFHVPQSPLASFIELSSTTRMETAFCLASVSEVEISFICSAGRYSCGALIVSISFVMDDLLFVYDGRALIGADRLHQIKNPG